VIHTVGDLFGGRDVLALRIAEEDVAAAA